MLDHFTNRSEAPGTLAYRPRDAADRLGVQADWLRREAEAGRIPCLRIGRRRHYMIHSVLLALADRAKGESEVERE